MRSYSGKQAVLGRWAAATRAGRMRISCAGSSSVSSRSERQMAVVSEEAALGGSADE
ncbi:hypothetical protein OH779_39970 [Actinacidiphila glaucinigra]|uniref:hypothetical protein n=1 Tax=Actinacidiphila glaucinigra TaxID=235986 RepID=UPI00386C94E4